MCICVEYYTTFGTQRLIHNACKASIITEGLSKLNVLHIFILIFKKKEYIKFLLHIFVEPVLTFYDAAGVFYEISSWSTKQAHTSCFI